MIRGLIVCLMAFCPFILSTSLSQAGISYYISSSTGDDAGTGSLETPFRSLEKISSIELQSSDTVFFKRGDRFDGHFVVNGSGSEDAPIVITAYGEGEKPIITGQAGEVGGGDYQEAIYVLNNDNLVFDKLEVQNERKFSRAGVDSVDAYGIFIHNSGEEILRNFVFRNMTFQNVYAVKEMNDPDDFNGLEVAAVRFSTDKNLVAGKEKNIQDVLMEDCFFTDLQRLGVHIKHSGGKTGVGNDSINRNMNFVFRNNSFLNTGGTCILPTNTYNCLIEHNIFDHPGAKTDPRMPGRGSSVWTWRCHNTVIQYNQCLHIRGYLDSHGIHIDHSNVNTFVQYNYMEDCEGGFVEILGGNLNAVYRFNISVNDGWRDNPNWKNSNHTLWINEKTGQSVHYCDSSYIYNNTIFIDSPYSTAIDINAKNTYIYNNIFYAINGSNIGGKQVAIDDQGSEFFLSNNLYFGGIADNFKNMDDSPVYGSPNFLNESQGEAQGYQLQFPSPVMSTGLAKRGPVLPGAGFGIFKDIPPYPETDFFGNPVDMSDTDNLPNIGACNAKDPNSTMEGILNLLPQYRCKVYPNPVDELLTIEISNNTSSHVDVRIIDLQGKIVQIEKQLPSNSDNNYSFRPLPEIPNGIYLLQVDTGKEQFNKRFVISS